jgi:DNA (cytosine-5)-methyltransferase 1
MNHGRTYKVVSLFSGGMGLDLGLHATGRFQVLACVEHVPAFCETIRANASSGVLTPAPLVFEGGVEEFDPLEILAAVGLRPGELDLLVGGPPCQSFSTAGRRGTTQDPRGTLLWQFLRYVDVMRPKFFLMENVRGLVSAALNHRPINLRPERGGLPLSPDEEPGSVVRLFARDLQSLEGCSYHVDAFEVNAVNYGAPQIRERVLFIGNRYNAVIDFPAPTHATPVELGTGAAEEQVQMWPDEQRTDLRPWKTLRDAIGDLREEAPEVLDFSPRKKTYLEQVPPGSNWRSLPVPVQQESMGAAWHAKGGRSGWWRRLTYDLPCPTLVTLPNHASTSLCHPTETRALSIREYARIQEFPDSWVFSGRLSEKYTQVGNAVPTRLGQVAGDVVARSLDTLSARHWKAYPQQPEAYRLIYLQSHVRTRNWFKDGETVHWDEAVSGATGDENARYGAAKTRRRVKTIHSAI